MPRYSILTATLCRNSLLRTCESLQAQGTQDWEHLVAIDMPLVFDAVRRDVIASIPADARRTFVRCGKNHGDYGNTCRRRLWGMAKGTFVLYLDDDNYLASRNSLSSMNGITGDWAIFPLLRHGARFYNDPPEFSKIDTANMLIKRELAEWPTPPKDERIPNSGYTKSYCADWLLAERLLQYKYEALPDLDPVVVMEQTNRGK